MNTTNEELRGALMDMARALDADLLAMSADEIAADWFWKWDHLRGIEWNLYQFASVLEVHKRRWRRWEEHHHGPSCVVERVRDKYVMPKVRELAEILREYMASTPPDATERLRAERDALAAIRDADRYRILRRGQKWSVIDGVGDTLRADELDAAIDAVMVADADDSRDQPEKESES